MKQICLTVFCITNFLFVFSLRRLETQLRNSHAEDTPASASDGENVKQGCSSCGYVESCEVMVCGSIYVDGHMKADFVSGCSLECPLGSIECKPDKNNKLRWQPVDPCAIDTTTTVRSTTTTTTSIPISTTTTTARISSSSTAAMRTNDTVSHTPGMNINRSSPEDVPSNSSTYNAENASTPISWTDQSNRPLSPWILIWLIPLLSVVAVILCLTVCCLAMHHRKRTRDKVHLKQTKSRDGRYDELVMNTIGSTANGYRTNRSTYAPGSAVKKQMKFTNGMHEVTKSNGTVSGKRRARSGLVKRGPLRLRGKGKLVSRQQGTEHKTIDWQETGTQEFITPPSPRSATGLRSNRNRIAGSMTFGQPNRAPSRTSQSSSVFKAPASVYPMQRSPSPLSCQFGEGHSIAQSSLYDSQQLANYSLSCDDTVMETNPGRRGHPLRDPYGYYANGDGAESTGRNDWYFQSGHDMMALPSDHSHMSTLTGTRDYDSFPSLAHLPTAFTANELPIYHASGSIRTNRDESSPRIPRI